MRINNKADINKAYRISLKMGTYLILAHSTQLAQSAHFYF